MSVPYQVITKDSPARMSNAAATLFAESAAHAAARTGRFTVALSGGSTPRGMHRLLAEEPFRSAILWEKTYIFWVDERCVPFKNEASNYGTASKDFIERVPINQTNVHPMPVHMEPHEGSRHYEKEIRDFFETPPNGIPKFDLILLGIGTDGHTASLFPGAKALKEQKRLVSAIMGGTPKVNRLTMTYPILNQARKVVFLASGKEKASVAKALIEEDRGDLPASGIQPIYGKLIWLLDQEAASKLQEK